MTGTYHCESGSYWYEHIPADATSLNHYPKTTLHFHVISFMLLCLCYIWHDILCITQGNLYLLNKKYLQITFSTADKNSIWIWYEAQRETQKLSVLLENRITSGKKLKTNPPFYLYRMDQFCEQHSIPVHFQFKLYNHLQQHLCNTAKMSFPNKVYYDYSVPYRSTL